MTKKVYKWTKQCRIKIKDAIKLIFENKQKVHPEKEVILRCIYSIGLTCNLLIDILNIQRKWINNRTNKYGKFLLDLCIFKKKAKMQVLFIKLKSIPNDNIEFKINILNEMLDLLLENNYKIILPEEEEPISVYDELKKNYTMTGNRYYITKEKYRMYLVEAVYRYFKYHKYNNNFYESGLNYNIITKNKELNEKQKYTLITSYEQNQKSFVMISAIIIYLSAGYVPIVFSKDINQKNQLIERIRKELKDLIEFLNKEHQFSKKSLEIFSDVLYFDSKNPCTDSSLEDALNGKNIRIIKCIKQATHVKRILENIKEDSKIALFLDEGHLTGGYKLINEIDEKIEEYHISDEEDKNFIIYDSYITDLKNKSKKVCSITATAQDIFMAEKNLYSDNILFIPPSKYYRGLINSYRFHNIDTKNENWANILLDTLTNRQPIIRYDYKNNTSGLHPNIYIYKAQSTIEKQKDFFYYRIENDKNMTYILFTGTTGFSLYHSSFSEKNIIINGYKSNNDKYHVHHFKDTNISISDVLQFLSERGVDIHPNICIINYHMCCEGISYSSHWDKKQNWHATGTILDLPNTVSASNARQTASRPFGAHGDDIINECWCPPKLQEKIIKAFELHDQQIKAILSVVKLSGVENVRVRDYLSELPLFKHLIPSKYHVVKNVTEYNNISKSKNQTVENKMFREDGRVINNLVKINSDKYNTLLENISKYDNTAKKDKEEFRKEIIIQRASLRKTKINIDRNKDVVNTDRNKDDNINGIGVNNCKFIIFKNIGNTSKIYYNKFVNYLKEKNKNKWISKAECISKICLNKNEINIIASTSWIWHAKDNQYNKNVNENHNGLLFKFKDNTWYVKYN